MCCPSNFNDIDGEEREGPEDSIEISIIKDVTQCDNKTKDSGSSDKPK